MAQAGESRELIFGYVSDATFEGKRHQPCRHMTALCPDKCNHATNVFSFRLDSLAVTHNPDSANAKWCKAEQPGGSYMAGERDFGARQLALANSLVAGDKVHLEWNHDYVTKDGCSSPERPVIKLDKL